MRRTAPIYGRGMLGALAFGATALLLAGCATPASGAGAASPDAISSHAAAAGIATDLVYTTEVDGYTLAPQSVGRGAEDGMSATWVGDGTGALITVRTHRGEMTEDTCPSTPLWEASGGTVTCTVEGDVWERSAAGIHEFVVARDGVLIRVIGAADAPQDDLRAAASAVRVPTDTELEELFSDVEQDPGEPVQRGDLPENGDGAPIDLSGPGG